jgi:hypothetical protein
MIIAATAATIPRWQRNGRTATPYRPTAAETIRDHGVRSS